MNTTRIAATVIGSIVAMTVFEAVIRPRIAASQSRSSNGNGDNGSGDNGGWNWWPS